MSIEVMMPQMGESVVEGTVTKWLVKEGDRVQEDQPLCEISTDKVDTEIPSPGAGVIAKLIAAEGETLPVGAPLAVIEASGAAAGAASAAPSVAAAPAGVRTQPKATPALPPAPGKATATGAPPAARPQQPPPTLRAVRSEPRPQAAAHSASQAPAGGASAPPAGGSGGAAAAAEPAAAAAPPRGAQAPGASGGVAAGAHRRYSPVVIRIAEEHGIDLTRVPGTGIGGRVSKRDVLAYLDALHAGQIQPPASGVTNGATNAANAQEASQDAAVAPAQPSAGVATRPSAVPVALPGGAGYRPPVYEPREGDVVEPFTRRRKLIAEHMVYSKTHSPHVGTLAEVDLTRVMRLRNEHKDAFLAHEGFALTLLPLAAAATVRALKEFPRMNASVVGDSLIVRHQINLGIAMDTQEGLLVPVIKAAEGMSVVGLAREIERLRRKIAEKKITADDLAGGSFTLTNPGREGNLFGFAIINQPQVGILRMGEIKKRPVVVEVDGEDAIAIRTMMYLALSYDHRVIDGVLGNSFLYRAARILEEADFEL